MAKSNKPAAAAEIVEQQNQAAQQAGYIVCDEWKGEFVNGVFEPLRKIRSNVKLTPEVFETLNNETNIHNPFQFIEVK